MDKGCFALGNITSKTLVSNLFLKEDVCFDECPSIFTRGGADDEVLAMDARLQLIGMIAHSMSPDLEHVTSCFEYIDITNTETITLSAIEYWQSLVCFLHNFFPCMFFLNLALWKPAYESQLHVLES